MKRYLKPYIYSDLEDSMVFIGGPRQVGKTTLSLDIAKSHYSLFQYLNWDTNEDRKKILNSEFQSDTNCIIFDEIHKYAEWKNYIKGIFDSIHQHFKILVTGSARLNVYRKGGDSLMGRYRYFRLHPFSLAEIFYQQKNTEERTIPEEYPVFQALVHTQVTKKDEWILQDLFLFGGFPSPLLKRSKKHLRRWHNERLNQLLKEDIRSLHTISELSLLQVLVSIIPERVASVFSINALREDIQVTHKTIKSWVEILENFYYCYRVYPYQSTYIRSIKKEAKIYLWDWSEIQNDGAKFENLIASHLLKFTHYLYDAFGYKSDLMYLRDKDMREVDFLLTIDNKPWFAVEVKIRDTKIDKNLLYFQKKLNIPFCYQVVMQEEVDFMQKNIRVISAGKFLTAFV